MKQKIVLKVPMHNEKNKSKAMQIAVSEQGVSSVSIGEDNDLLEVIGEGVDSVCLAKSLRKKFCFADILTIGEVMPPPPPSPPPSPPSPYVMEYPSQPYIYQLPHFQGTFYEPQYVVYEKYPPNICSIM